MKTLADIAKGAIVEPGEVYQIAAANMEPEHIGHYATDLYLKVNDISRAIVGALENRALLSMFRSEIDGQLWYEFPFCYIPGWSRDPWED